MSLENYLKKRNFEKTSEPKPELTESFCEQIVEKYKGVKLKRPVYVIQEHHASHLHWDLRLEINGVLKSWAIPKQPPTQPGIRRLAVQTEDHPIEYACFEGTIPEGNYGAGEVIIWDKGTFKIESLKPEKIVFEIFGEKLKGKYVLVKLKPSPKLKGENNWLFFKKKEE